MFLDLDHPLAFGIGLLLDQLANPWVRSRGGGNRVASPEEHGLFRRKAVPEKRERYPGGDQ